MSSSFKRFCFPPPQSMEILHDIKYSTLYIPGRCLTKYVVLQFYLYRKVHSLIVTACGKECVHKLFHIVLCSVLIKTLLHTGTAKNVFILYRHLPNRLPQLLNLRRVVCLCLLLAQYYLDYHVMKTQCQQVHHLLLGPRVYHLHLLLNLVGQSNLFTRIHRDHPSCMLLKHQMIMKKGRGSLRMSEMRQYRTLFPLCMHI